MCSEQLGEESTRQPVTDPPSTVTGCEPESHPGTQLYISLAQEVATGSSPADRPEELTAIFNRILTDLESCIQYNAANVFREEDGHLRLIATRHFTTFTVGFIYPIAEMPLYQEMAQTKKPIVVRDVHDEPRFRLFSTQLVIYGWMAIPLIVNGMVQGVITFSSERIGAFTEQDANLAQTFINQAAHTIEKTEMDHTLSVEKRNLEMLYELSQSLVETLDPKQVAERALQLATAALGAYAGEIFHLEDTHPGYLTLLASVGRPFCQYEPVTQFPYLQIGHGLVGSVAATCRPIIASDTAAEPCWIHMQSDGPDDDTKSAVAIPLLARDQLIGVLTLSSHVRGFFQQSALPTLQAIAAPVAMALQNARLFTEEQNRRQEAESLRRATAALVLDLDLEEILTQLLQRLRQVVPFDSATFMLRTEDRLHAVAGIGLPHPEEVIGQFFPLGNDLFRQLQARRRAIFYTDVQQVAAFEGWGNTDYVRGWMGVPLLHRDVLIGYLTVDSRTVGAYKEAEATLAQAFANQATVMIVNAQLLQESQRIAAEQQTVSQILRQLNATSRVPEILPAINSGLHRLTACDTVELAIFDEDEQFVTVLRHRCSETEEVVISQTRYPRTETAVTETLLMGQIHHTADLAQEQSFTVEATYFAEGYRARICWPLQLTHRILGSIQLLWRSPSPQRTYSAEIFAQVVDAIAMAVEKNLLFTQTQRRIEEKENLNRFTLALRPLATSAEILQVALENILSTFRGTFAKLCMPAGEPGYLEVVAEVGLPNVELDGRLYGEESVFGHVFKTGQPYLSGIGLLESLMQTSLDDRMQTRYQLVSALYAPVHSGTQITGVLAVFYVGSNPQYTWDDLKLLATMAEIIGTALHRSNLMETMEQGVRSRTQELAEANERLKELDRLKSEFVANVSHELRTPLTNIRFYVDLLRRGRAEKREQYLTVLESEILRLHMLIEAILDLSRLNAARDQGIFEVTAFDIGQLLSEIYRNYRLQALNKGISFSYREPSQPMVLSANRNQIIQVVTNLLTNAINYTTSGGYVTLSVCPAQNDGIEIAIHDTGMGIEPDELNHLFERFYRSPRAANLGVPGTGLGLSIVKEIVDLHRGTVRAESKKGAGSTFTVWLPVSRLPLTLS
jgi:signal transduction histidine kinase